MSHPRDLPRYSHWREQPLREPDPLDLPPVDYTTANPLAIFDVLREWQRRLDALRMWRRAGNCTVCGNDLLDTNCGYFTNPFQGGQAHQLCATAVLAETRR